MKRLAAKIRRKCKKSISKGSAVFLIVAGILLATVFTVGMCYWTKPIEKADAIRVDATFTSYQKHYRRHNLSSLTLCFSDHESLSIDNACFTSDALNHIENMTPRYHFVCHFITSWHQIEARFSNSVCVAVFDVLAFENPLHKTFSAL